MLFVSQHCLSKRKERKGFTLIEVLLYSAILTILIGAIMTFVFMVVSQNDDLRVTAELIENTIFLQQKITWVLTGASVVSAPAVQTIGSVMTVTKDGTTYTMDLLDGTVRLKSGTGSPVPLTNEFVVVASLSFEHQSFSPDIKSTVRVQAWLQDLTQPTLTSTSLDWYVSIQ